MFTTSSNFLHWNYFLALESDFEKLSRYVEFSENNYGTYSLEMVRLLLASSSEVDVVLKGLCKKISPRKKPNNITTYRKMIVPEYHKICNMKVHIPRYNLDIHPWDNWLNDRHLTGGMPIIM